MTPPEKPSERSDTVIRSIIERIKYGNIVNENELKSIQTTLIELIPHRHHQLVGLSKDKVTPLELVLGLQTHLFLKGLPEKHNKGIKKRLRRL